MGRVPLCALRQVWLQSQRSRGRILLPGSYGEAMEAQGGTLLGSISEFCRRTGMAESTFGRRAVNDGKFVARLRDGARVTPETLQRVNQFITRHGHAGSGDSPPELMPLISGGARPAQAATPAAPKADP